MRRKIEMTPYFGIFGLKWCIIMLEICIYLPWVSGSPPFQWFTFSQGIAHPGCSVDVKTEDQKGLLWPDCTLSHHVSDRRFRWPVLDAVCRDHTLSISRQGNLRSDPCQSKFPHFWTIHELWPFQGPCLLYWSWHKGIRSWFPQLLQGLTLEDMV